MIVKDEERVLADCLASIKPWGDQRDYLGAKRWIEQGLALYPKDPELLFRAGIVCREIDDLKRSEQCYVTLLTEREIGHIDSIDITMAGCKAHHNLAMVYQDMERWADAEAQWRAAVDKTPDFVPSWVGLGELYLRLGRFRDTEPVVKRLLELDMAEANRFCDRLRSVAIGTA